MATVDGSEKIQIGDLDVRILHCLQVAPRAPFAVVADVLGVSEQTVARRFRRLRSVGVVRVVGLVNPVRLGQTGWGVRVRCRPQATTEIGRALARRPDVSWVTVATGGTELICVLRSRSEADRDALMLDQLPRTTQVLSIDAYAFLHVFRGSTTHDWRLGGRLLPGSDVERLTATQPAAPSGTGERPVELTPEDEPLLAELAVDGRATYAALAAATGWSEGRVTRRLAQLLGAGVVYLDIDFAMRELGYPTSAFVSLTVAPGDLHEVGLALASHDHVMFVGATTGRFNLVVSAAFRSAEELYRFVTDDLGSLRGVGQVEVTLIARTLKQAGSLLHDGRLSPPAPPAAPARRR
ncbi:AsnC family transcriptional regulator [Luteipulveratus sp. YIM 133132]|uniref:AsnC family transcriptional regulator n=1 Tax=Luteipulveratus flavus TaxID=3031728 RepID=A0ABT6C6B0_9MICO|nr:MULTISPECIES: AsnC family transcriptional regulator [unclassified Luteipulveratus]MDE9364107.1 AsnC family transcriptional regulator [Luteipulveratus sp. YIM 133132]MDF8264325.1 AsnC family transcriptional regulator [Luteipulveratus sp. YIM 133296]